MKIKIVGGSGYLGNRLSEFLKKKDHSVVSGSRNIEISKSNNNFTYIDFNSSTNMDQFCKEADVIIYSGGMSQHECNNISMEDLNNQINEFYNFYDTVIKNQIKKFIYISTSQVYESSNRLVTEESKTFAKDSYTKRHLKAENYILDKNKNGKTDNFIIRLSNAFGSPINPKTKCWHLAINDFVLNSVKNKKIFIKSDGKQERNFVSISYFCEAIYFILNYNSEKKNTIFNLGGHQSYSIYSAANLIADRYFLNSGNKIQIKTNSLNKSYNLKVSYSSEKIKRLGLKKSSEADFINEIDSLINYCLKYKMFI